MKRSISTTSGALAGALLALGVAIPAAGAPAVLTAVGDESNANGLWYFDWYGIQGFHDQGIDGSGVTIAMIDAPINLEVPTLRGADIRVQSIDTCTDESGTVQTGTSTDVALGYHGTNVASLIVGSGEGYPGQTGVKGVAPGATLLTYPIYNVDDNTVTGMVSCTSLQDSIPASIIDAVDQGADIITVSLSSDTGPEFSDAMLYALQHDVVVVGSLPNGETVLDVDLGVGTMNGVVSVRGLQPDGSVNLNVKGEEQLSDWVDVGAPGGQILVQGTVDAGWEAQSLGLGSSFATPIVAAEIALAMQKYPSATPNQLLQSLIHNTGTEPHELEFDSSGRYGYGAVDAISFLAADPTQYEDVNPFIEEAPRNAKPDDVPEDDWWGWGPTIEQLNGTETPASPEATASADPEEEEDEPAPNEDTDGSLPAWLLPSLIGVGALILIGVIVAIIVTARSRNKGDKKGPV